MFEFTTNLDDVSSLQLRIYYSFLFICLLYTFIKYPRSTINIFIILIFFDGLFSFLSPIIQNVFSILYLIIALKLFLESRTKSKLVENKFINLTFTLFTISFFLSVIFNSSKLVFSLSQYSKFLVPYLFLLYLRNKKLQEEQLDEPVNLFISLFLFQILFSVLKIIIIGFNEAIVGSISLLAGSVATVLPILAFILLWVYKKADFNLTDWIFVLSLFVIGFASNKRAIWIALPLTIFIFFVYVGRKKIRFGILKLVLSITILILLGLKLSPSLNPEKKIWGTINFNYALEYIYSYSFGNEQGKKGSGRGGGNLAIIDFIFSSNDKLNLYFGYGLEASYGTSYSEFDSAKFGLSDKGSASGIVQYFIATGLFGVLTVILLFVSYINTIHDFRSKSVFYIIFLTEYVFYSNVIVQSTALFILFIFNIHTINFKKK